MRVSCYLSLLFSYCIKNDFTSQRLSRKVRLKKHKPILLCVCVCVCVCVDLNHRKTEENSLTLFMIKMVSKVVSEVLRREGGLGVEYRLKLCFVIYEWPFSS